MIRELTYQIEDVSNHLTILQFLKQKGFPHAVIVQLKKTQNGILLNQKWEYVNALLHRGDCLVLRLEEENTSEHIPPVYHPLTIVYEDEDILVLNKPSGMPIHPSFKHYENTLANAVCYYYASQDIPFTFRCVNRLDRDTTGLTIVAKHMLSSAILSQAITKREIHREYLAIVDGITSESGVVDAPIGRKEGSSIERVVDFANGETAVTHYERLCYNERYSLLSLWLETGRTHQIRVHMKHIGYPLLGDFLYHPDYSAINRQALHSYKLVFFHPITGKELTFTAPLPDDMASVFPNFVH